MPDALAIGIDIGGTRSKLGLVDLAAGKVLAMQVTPTEKHDAQRFMAGLHAAIGQLQAEAQRLSRPLLGVGVGVTGFVFADGTVDSTYGFLPFMEDFPLARLITEHSGLPCRADNDARVVALGEARYGAGRGFDRVLVLTLGTGLGLGLVAGGRFDSPLAYGHMGGHLRVRATDFECYCGRRGCLESLVSASALVAAAERAGWTQALDAEAIVSAARRGDALAAALVETLLADLRLGLDLYTTLYAPDVVVLGGGLAKGLTDGLAPDLARLAAPAGFLKPYKHYRCELRLAALDEQGGVLGAAALLGL